jgi:UDP-2-acetamido-2,6-beta-L-arabino-hexul-4-ose reductase
MEAAIASLDGASRLLHIAGINRGAESDITSGNIRFAEQLSGALLAAKTPPPVVVFANSIQSGNNTAYGEAKKRASALLEAASSRVGAAFIDVQLPNLFGEHGVPFYNSVVATFCHLLATGGRPTIETDRELELVHVQDAADLLIGLTADRAPVSSYSTVVDVLSALTEISKVYRTGDIPDLSTSFDRNLFNTYRSFTFPDQSPIPLMRNADARGSFFEVIRSHGGQGQSSFSTTVPHIARGNHFHRRKVERFAVLAGEAVISLRKLFSSEVIEFTVSGDAPCAVDMPTLWAHKITNIGSGELYTSFWSNEIFDPEAPDTFAEAV